MAEEFVLEEGVESRLRPEFEQAPEEVSLLADLIEIFPPDFVRHMRPF